MDVIEHTVLETAQALIEVATENGSCTNITKQLKKGKRDDFKK